MLRLNIKLSNYFQILKIYTYIDKYKNLVELAKKNKMQTYKHLTAIICCLNNLNDMFNYFCSV